MTRSLNLAAASILGYWKDRRSAFLSRRGEFWAFRSAIAPVCERQPSRGYAVNTKIGLLAAAMTVGLVASASAEQLRGPYVGIAGGVNIQGPDSADLRINGGDEIGTIKRNGTYKEKT